VRKIQLTSDQAGTTALDRQHLNNASIDDCEAIHSWFIIEQDDTKTKYLRLPAGVDKRDITASASKTTLLLVSRFLNPKYLSLQLRILAAPGADSLSSPLDFVAGNLVLVTFDTRNFGGGPIDLRAGTFPADRFPSILSSSLKALLLGSRFDHNRPAPPFVTRRQTARPKKIGSQNTNPAAKV